MGRYDNTKRNQYNSTPRRVHDADIDRVLRKLARLREENLADIGVLAKQIRMVQLMMEAIEKRKMEQRDLTDLDRRGDKYNGNEELG